MVDSGFSSTSGGVHQELNGNRLYTSTVQMKSKWQPGKPERLTQCAGNVGPASQTLG